MSYPIFPTVDQVMQILMGEIPQGVYATDLADNPDKTQRSFSSSEIRAHAAMFAQLEANLNTIFLDKFASTVTVGSINRWQKDYFIKPQDGSLPFSVQQARLIAKIQATGGLSYPYIYGQIFALLNPLGLTFDLLACTGTLPGEWILDLSQLDVDTYLALMDPILGVNPGGYSLDCNAILNLVGTTTFNNNTITAVNNTANILPGAGLAGPGIPPNTTVLSTTSTTIVMSTVASSSHVDSNVQVQNYILAGVTAQQLADIQATAYTYYVNIHGVADAVTLAELDELLTAAEKAGVTHVIINNAPPPIDPNIVDMGGGLGAYRIDQIDCGNGITPGATYDVWDFNI